MSNDNDILANDFNVIYRLPLDVRWGFNFVSVLWHRYAYKNMYGNIVDIEFKLSAKDNADMLKSLMISEEATHKELLANPPKELGTLSKASYLKWVGSQEEVDKYSFKSWDDAFAHMQANEKIPEDKRLLIKDIICSLNSNYDY